MNKRTLYDIENDFRAIFDEIEQNDGDISPEMNNALTIAENEFADKTTAYIGRMKMIGGRVDVIDAEIKRLQNRKKVEQNHHDILRDRITDAVKQYGVPDIPQFKISLRKSTAVNITDAEQLPDWLLVKKTSYSPDKKEIKSQLESGFIVTGAELQHNQSLQIK